MHFLLQTENRNTKIAPTAVKKKVFIVVKWDTSFEKRVSNMVIWGSLPVLQILVILEEFSRMCAILEIVWFRQRRSYTEKSHINSREKRIVDCCRMRADLGDPWIILVSLHNFWNRTCEGEGT